MEHPRGSRAEDDRGAARSRAAVDQHRRAPGVVEPQLIGEVAVGGKRGQDLREPCAQPVDVGPLGQRRQQRARGVERALLDEMVNHARPEGRGRAAGPGEAVAQDAGLCGPAAERGDRSGDDRYERACRGRGVQPTEPLEQVPVAACLRERAEGRDDHLERKGSLRGRRRPPGGGGSGPVPPSRDLSGRGGQCGRDELAPERSRTRSASANAPMRASALANSARMSGSSGCETARSRRTAAAAAASPASVSARARSPSAVLDPPVRPAWSSVARAAPASPVAIWAPASASPTLGSCGRCSARLR